MVSLRASWATQQMAEFLAAVSSFDTEELAMRGAVERVAEAFEAEVAALIDSDSVAVATGFPAGRTPEAELRAIATGRKQALKLAGVGECGAISVPVEDDPLEALVLARSDPARFSPEEENLLRAMTRILGLTLQMLRVLANERALRERSESQSAENAILLDSLQERQKLLERLSRIQSSIASRMDLDEVLDRIVRGAAELLGDEVCGMRLVDAEQPHRTITVATTGVGPEVREATHQGEVGIGLGGRSIAERRLIVVEDYGNWAGANPSYAADGVRAAMAAPVREDGQVVGALTVSTRREGRRYSKAEREMLLMFAEHASLALNDAKAVRDAIHQALHDPLTGLPNRTLLRDRLEHTLARAQRTHSQVAVVFLDLDDFNTINDSLGHPAGDELLAAFARRLAASVRIGDTAARYGGDEFAVLVEDIGGEDVADAAHRILEALEEPFVVGSREVFISACIGIAVGHEAADELLRNADLALYRAKSKGQGRYEVFEPDMHAAVVERLELEGDLQHALDRDQLELHYQPIVKLRTGEIAGVEALLRWEHHERGLLSAAEFIPLAEDTRLILPIGRWVLREACRQAVRWRQEHPEYPALAVSVNLSSVQLGELGLIDEVAGALQESRLDPQSLILELTETAFMIDTEAVARAMGKLKKLGVQLAVDDFGTGYASLQHLRRFPIDVLKIAKSFVDGVTGASHESALARSIIDLGGSFQLRVVAEGIERPEQHERLVELGCDLGQGFHFAPPVEADALSDMLAEGARLIPD